MSSKDLSNTLDSWLEAQRIKGGLHGFECIGIARMKQVWEAAQENLRQQLAERDAELKRINYAINDPRVDLTITAAEAITELRQQVTLLRDASQKLVDRWDSPLWKDHPHTANYIHALRKALDATNP